MLGEFQDMTIEKERRGKHAYLFYFGDFVFVLFYASDCNTGQILG